MVKGKIFSQIDRSQPYHPLLQTPYRQKRYDTKSSNVSTKLAKVQHDVFTICTIRFAWEQLVLLSCLPPARIRLNHRSIFYSRETKRKAISTSLPCRRGQVGKEAVSLHKLPANFQSITQHEIGCVLVAAEENAGKARSGASTCGSSKNSHSGTHIDLDALRFSHRE